jgi:L-iditol 2-dehydrogenase
MRAAVFYEPMNIKIEDVEKPKANKGEIVVKNELTLTCGTDLKMYKRGHPLAKPPLIIGHEFVGKIVEVGEGVNERFKVGKKVVSANSAPCSSCYYCKRGKENLCENLYDVIIGFTSQGAYAEYVKIPERIANVNTFIVPDNVNSKSMALLEPLACVVHGIDLINIGLGDTVAVIGSGPIGLMHLILAKLRGASKVFVIDISEKRLEKAIKLGADYTISSKDRQVEELMSLTNQRGIDVVIEAVGLPETWKNAVKMARKGGKILLFGGCPSGTTITLDTHIIHYGELTIIGSFHHEPRSVRKAFDLICSKKVTYDEIVTHEVKLNEIEKAFNLMSKGEAVKVAVIIK